MSEYDAVRGGRPAKEDHQGNTYLEFSQIGRQFGTLVGEGEGEKPVEHALPVSRVWRCFREIGFRVVQRTAQECLTLIPFPIPNRRLLDAADGEVTRNLDRTRQEHVVDKHGGVLDLEALFRIAETFLQV